MFDIPIYQLLLLNKLVIVIEKSRRKIHRLFVLILHQLIYTLSQSTIGHKVFF